jgi:hypothetical protein
MKDSRLHLVVRQTLGMVCVLLLFVFAAGVLFAQEPAPPAQSSPPAQPLSPDQLDTLVAPVALYPDALLSQVLVAATYPLEVAEAPQWLQQNRNLQGQQLIAAARQQNWDPSIQALVAFPDVINLLSSNIRWTTDLGNAFLGQQADVMNAVQRMRAQAKAAGKLNSNDRQTVTTETQGDQTAIDIQPANPQVVYVPQYNPESIWGPPAYGYYPPLYYPDYYGYGYGYGSGIYIGGFFGGLGWGGWGWGPNWFNYSIFQNYYFFNHYGFHGFYGRGGGGGRGIWAHDPAHRLGVAYPNRGLAARYGGAGGGLAGGRVGGQRLATPRQASFNRTNQANIANRGNVGANAAQRGAPAGGTNRVQSPQSQPGGRSLAAQGNRASAGNWQRFGGPGAGTSQGQRGAPTARQSMNAAPASGSGGSQWSHFGGSGSQPSYRSSPTYGGGSGYRSTPSYGGNSGGSRSTPTYRPSPTYSGGSGSGYRSTPSYGGSFSGSRSTPSYRPSPTYSGGSGYRSAPSYGGSFSGSRSVPSYRPSPSSGGGYRSAPSYGSGGGGFHGGGGGGSSHGGGGSHSGRR